MASTAVSRTKITTTHNYSVSKPRVPVVPGVAPVGSEAPRE
jgi:hypothetical protein